jgi:hypothetical protein
MNNAEVNELTSPLFHDMLFECSREAFEDAQNSGIIESVEVNLSNDIITATHHFYPDALVEVNYQDPSPRQQIPEVRCMH